MAWVPAWPRTDGREKQGPTGRLVLAGTCDADTETPEAALTWSFFLTGDIFLKAISCFRAFHGRQPPPESIDEESNEENQTFNKENEPFKDECVDDENVQVQSTGTEDPSIMMQDTHSPNMSLGKCLTMKLIV